MKTNFKKLALAAGITAAMGGLSLPAHAIFVGDPGEAALIPYVTSVATSPGNYLNTVVKITVPKSVGNDIITNFYTAPNSSPTNGIWSTPGPEAPGDADLVAGGTGSCAGGASPGFSCIHWYYMSEKSVKITDGNFPVSQDDVAVFDWGAVSGGAYEGRLGYLLFVTERANTGAAANFSFTADAWLVMGQSAQANTKVSIPALPLADGPDTTERPTITNNVIEIGPNGGLSLIASPLVSGNRTIWADGKSNTYVFDLPLANNYNTAGLNAGTLAIVWNDRNAGELSLVNGKFVAGPWATIPAYRYNNNESKCSGVISLPDQLNQVWIPARPNYVGNIPVPILPSAFTQASWNNAVVPTIPGTVNPVTGIPGGAGKVVPIDPYASTASVDGKQSVSSNGICTVPVNDGINNLPLPATNTTTGGFYDTIWNDVQMSGGFVKVAAPQPAIYNTNTVEGAAVYFTIPMHSDGPFTGWPLFYGAALLGHPRGAFTNAAGN